MVEPVPGYLKYRVLDPLSGAVVIDDLPHPHQSSWTIEGYQPGSKGLGRFTVPLYPPNSEEYLRYKRVYDLLDENQRIEGYLGDVISGAPRFTGVIRANYQQAFDSFSIGGYDSILVAESQQVFPGESVNGKTFDVFNQYLGRNLMSWSDDFSPGWSTGYIQSSGTWTNGSDGAYGTYVTTGSMGANADQYMETTYSPANSVYQPLHVASGIFSIAPTADTSNAGQAGVFVGFVSGNGDTFYMGEVTLLKSGSSWNVNAGILERASGIYNTLASATNVFTGVSSPFLCQIQLIGYYTISGGVASNLVYHLIVNGKDVCQWSFGNPAGISGPVGLRVGNGATVGAQVKCYQFTFKSRASVSHQSPLAFQQGSSLSGSDWTANTMNQTWSGQTFLDIWNLCAATEGGEYRKTPAAGLNNDVIDFSSSVGTDYSLGSGNASIVFTEGENLVDLIKASNVELFASALRFNTAAGSSGSASNGTIVYDNLTSVSTYGIWDDTDQNLGVSDFSITRGLAKRLSLLRGSTVQGKVVTVMRDPATVDKFRELDYITIHAPSRNLNYAKVRVLSYTFTEGSPTMTLTCDQYPINSTTAQIRVTRRIRDNIQSIGNQFGNR